MDLTKLYDYYHSASDVKIFFVSPDTGRMVNVDKIMGLGYTGEVAASPVYTLGKSTPAFFSKGNFLGHGMFTIPFIDERFLKTSLQYIFDEVPDKPSYGDSLIDIDPGSMTDEQFRDFRASSDLIDMNVISIGSVISEFDIIITLDNSTPFHSEYTKSITLKGVKLTSDSFEVNSQSEGVLQNAYRFYFKDIKR